MLFFDNIYLVIFKKLLIIGFLKWVPIYHNSIMAIFHFFLITIDVLAYNSSFITPKIVSIYLFPQLLKNIPFYNIIAASAYLQINPDNDLSNAGLDLTAVIGQLNDQISLLSQWSNYIETVLFMNHDS